MNEIEKLFQDDVQNKKVIGRSARHVARTRRKVVLPSDRLTEKEIEKMSGEVHSYNLGNPMKWAQFKEMPDDLRKAYLERLRDRYNATNKAIGEMMGVSDQSVMKEAHRLGVRALTKRDRPSAEWFNFVAYGTPKRKPVQLDPLEEIKEAAPVVAEIDNTELAATVRELLDTAIVESIKPIDMVNHPPHYTAGDIECIDAIAAATANLNGMEAVCTAQIIKYVWRYSMKNGAEDLKKAGFYLDRLINVVEGRA